MELLPNAKYLRLNVLAHDGIVTKTADLSNIIPATFEDFVHSSKRKIADMPAFFDHEMIYFNSFHDEFYVFDNTGVWNEEGVNNPAL
jgi:hypothetical protein